MKRKENIEFISRGLSRDPRLQTNTGYEAKQLEKLRNKAKAIIAEEQSYKDASDERARMLRSILRLNNVEVTDIVLKDLVYKYRHTKLSQIDHESLVKAAHFRTEPLKKYLL